RRPEKAPTALPIGQSKQPGNPDAPSYGSARRHRARRLATLPALAGPGLLRAARLGGGAGLLALVPGVAVVAARRQAGVLGEQLADLLAAGRRGILAARRLIAAIGGRLVGRDQLVLAGADQRGAARAQQRLAQQRPVLRVVVAHEGLVQGLRLLALDHYHALALVGHLAQRVLAGVVHGGGRGHGRRVEGLHLVGAEAVGLQPQGQVHHVLVGGARVRRDEVGDQVLLLARLLRVLVEHLLEAVIGADARLHHLVQRPALGVLRGDLQ